MAAHELHEDVVMEILSLLPVKSLLRFRCVCKLWRALMKSPAFIALHLSRASARKNDCLLIKRGLQDVSKNVISFHYYSNIETLDDLSGSFHVPLFDDINCSVQLLGPSNGIICLTNTGNRIVLCNPATREFRALPVPLFTCPAHWRIDICAVGFGFDPITNDYKVVMVFELHEEGSMSSGFDSWKAQVYNLSSNSWRQIETHPGASLCQLPSSTTLCNGACHWYATLGGDDRCIVAFHMGNEVFQKIPMPDSCVRRDGYNTKLDVLDDCLALILFDISYSWPEQYFDTDSHFDIWVMKDYGVKESWTRYCKIGYLDGVPWPLAFWKDSELLLETWCAELVSYNLHDQTVKHLQIHGVSSTLGVGTYSESLVSVMGGEV